MDAPSDASSALAETITDTPAPHPSHHHLLHQALESLSSPASLDSLDSPSSSAGRVAILLVEDDYPIRRMYALALAGDGVVIHEADNGLDAVALIATNPYDVVLLDLGIPKLSGSNVLTVSRANRATPNMKVMVLSGHGDSDHLSTTLESGADDFIPKPFTMPHLRARVKSLIRLKQAQDRSDQLTERLAVANSGLETALNARDGELIHARDALVLALARLVEARSRETGPHLLRIQLYAQVLGNAAAQQPRFAARLSEDYLRMVEAASPLHDIGKVAVPDAVLNKPGRLTDDERQVMQGHAAAGADTLASVITEFPFAVGFFHTAIEIARHHHEKWDGTGYPARLAGEAIPLSARLVAIGDVYDALRSPRVYKPAMDHAQAVAQMSSQPGHFDPDLFQVFLTIQDEFDRVFNEAVE